MSNLKKHGYYTNVYQKSYEVFAKHSKKLDPLLIALMVDPLEAEDAKKLFGKKIPHSLDDFRNRDGQMAVDAALQTVVQWLQQQSSLGSAVAEIAAWNCRLAVWLDVAASRWALSAISSNDARLTDSLNTVERWVRGLAGQDELSTALMDSVSAVSDASNVPWILPREAYAARAVMRTAQAADGAFMINRCNSYSEYVPDEAASAHYGYSSRPIGEKLIELRSVLANACMTFPR